LRQKYVGSSDIAALFNLDQFQTALDVWLEKTGKLTEQPDKAVFRRGRYMEGAILDYAQDELGPLQRDADTLEFIAEDLHLIDHADALVLATGNPVEAKSQGLFANEVWGKAGTDEIPDRAILQGHVHMICTNKPFCHVPVFLADREFQMFGVPRSDRVVDRIKEQVLTFWEKHIQADVPPEILPSPEVLTRIIRVPNKTISIPDGIVTQWQADRAARLTAEKVETASKTAVLAALGDAEVGTCSFGSVEYFETHRSGYTVGDSVYRTPTFKKGTAK